MARESILVSACLLGEPCRYNGTSCINRNVLEFVRSYDAVVVCPEQLAGLPTPRMPLEVQPDGRVLNRLGVDFTDELEEGARQACELAREHGCKLAVLKSKSPTCGVHQVYDGSFSGELVDGRGIAARALDAMGVTVHDEHDLAFLEKLAACADDAPAGGRRTAPEASNKNVHKSMKGNKRANTKPELLVRERLRAAGLGGYRLQWKAPGRPDIAWPGKKVAVFVNGCFWHRCPHCNLALPKAHVEYWAVKFNRNVERDRANIEALERDGWKVHVIWECQLKKKAVDATLAELFPVLAAELGKPLSE